jgi:hypothetical protein
MRPEIEHRTAAQHGVEVDKYVLENVWILHSLTIRYRPCRSAFQLTEVLVSRSLLVSPKDEVDNNPDMHYHAKEHIIVTNASEWISEREGNYFVSKFDYVESLRNMELAQTSFVKNFQRTQDVLSPSPVPQA